MEMKELPPEMQETLDEIERLLRKRDETEDPRERKRLRLRVKELRFLQMWRMDQLGWWDRLGKRWGGISMYTNKVA